MSKICKGDVVLVHNKTGGAWVSEDGAFVLHWLSTMNQCHCSYYVVERALRLTGSGARTSLVECGDGEYGEFALLKKTRDATELVCDESTGVPYVFPVSWLRVAMKARDVQEAAKPAPAQAPTENLMNGIAPANYEPKHPIYKWRRDAPWDPEDAG